MLAQSWQKYGLIVVGNIVFFILLYFVSYRPNNDESRAADLLSMAQEQEMQSRPEAAKVLYGKVIARFKDTEAARMAEARLSAVEKAIASLGGARKIQIVTPQLDLSSMLDRRPSLYVATYLAEHYGDRPALKPKLRAVILSYLDAAMRIDGLSLAELRREKALRTKELEQELFAIRPGCGVQKDLWYDDFQVRNDNFFPWHGARVRLEVRQGNETSSGSADIDELAPGAAIDVFEFHLPFGVGAVSCTVDVATDEGRGAWRGRVL